MSAIVRQVRRCTTNFINFPYTYIYYFIRKKRSFYVDVDISCFRSIKIINQKSNLFLGPVILIWGFISVRNSLRIINHEWEKSGAHPLICNFMHDFYFVFRNIEFFLVLNQQTLCSLHTRWLYAWLEPYVFYWCHTLHFPHRDPPWYTSPNHKTTSPQLRQIILRFFSIKTFLEMENLNHKILWKINTSAF